MIKKSAVVGMTITYILHCNYIYIERQLYLQKVLKDKNILKKISNSQIESCHTHNNVTDSVIHDTRDVASFCHNGRIIAADTRS